MDNDPCIFILIAGPLTLEGMHAMDIAYGLRYDTDHAEAMPETAEMRLWSGLGLLVTGARN